MPCVPSTVRVSVASGGTEANGVSKSPSISQDGRFVAFTSTAPNLVPGDTNGLADIFVRDTCAGAVSCVPSTVRVSLASDGSQLSGFPADRPSLSGDGRFVAFDSNSSNLVPGDTNAVTDVFLARTGF